MSRYRVAVYLWNEETRIHDRQTIMSEAGDTRYPMEDVPRCGDVVFIAPAGWVSVGARQFMFPSYNSTNWPVLESEPLRVDVDLICTKAGPMVE